MAQTDCSDERPIYRFASKRWIRGSFPLSPTLDESERSRYSAAQASSPKETFICSFID